jgi:hypothetical protein
MHLLLLYVHFYHATTLLAGKGVDKLVWLQISWSCMCTVD